IFTSHNELILYEKHLLGPEKSCSLYFSRLRLRPFQLGTHGAFYQRTIGTERCRIGCLTAWLGGRSDCDDADHRITDPQVWQQEGHVVGRRLVIADFAAAVVVGASSRDGSGLVPLWCFHRCNGRGYE